MHDSGVLASSSLDRHLARGAIGFGLIGAGFALTISFSPVALLLAPIGMVALRGCPTCWIAGLIQTISVGRLERTCAGNSCTLVPTRDRQERVEWGGDRTIVFSDGGRAPASTLEA
jgi:hypothetical protein